MATIVTRSGKGSALTFQEGDANFTNLNNDKLEDITNESIGDLSDVSITNVSNQQVLQYNDQAGAWQNATFSGGASTLNDLTDVNTTNVQQGSILKYDQMSSSFVVSTDANTTYSISAVGEMSNAKITLTDSNSGTDNIYIAPGSNISLSVVNDTIEISATDTGIALTDLSVGTEGSASGNGSIGYNSGTGVFTYTPPTASGIGALADITGENIGSLSDVSITNPSDLQILVYVQGTWVNATGNLSALSDAQITNPATNQILSYNGSQFVNVDKIENIELDNYKETVYSLGSTDSPTINVANGNVQTVTISSGLALPAFTNAETGQSVTLIVSGSGTATGTAAYKFAGGSTDLTTSSVVSIFYDGTTYWTSIATDFQ
jgi:hypothetical protein